MILSFGNHSTEDIYNGTDSRAARSIPRTIWRVACRKLDLLNAAHDLRDLQSPAGNRLGALKAQWRGYHGIRINDQYRIVFKWTDGNAKDVEIVDYH